MSDIFAISHLSDYERVKLFEVVGTPSSDYNLRDPKVKELIDSDNLSFDLVINEDFYHDSWLMFGYKFNAPTITICKSSITKGRQSPRAPIGLFSMGIFLRNKWKLMNFRSIRSYRLHRSCDGPNDTMVICTASSASVRRHHGLCPANA